MNLSMEFPKSVALPKECVLYCGKQMIHELFGDDPWRDLVGGDSDAAQQHWLNTSKETIGDIVLHGSRCAYTSRPTSIAKRWRKTERTGAFWHLQKRLLVLKYVDGPIRIATDWHSSILASGFPEACPPEIVADTRVKLLTQTLHYLRWCEQGGSPDLGRYLAQYYCMF